MITNLPEVALSNARRVLLDTLADECYTLTPSNATGATDKYGTPLKNTYTQSEPIKCRFTMMNAQEAEDIARVYDNAQYKFTLPYGTNVPVKNGYIFYKGSKFPIVGTETRTYATASIAYTAERITS